MSRALAITYAGLTIGSGQSGTTYHLTDKYTVSVSDRSASVEFEVVVQDSTRSTFLTAEAALITAYTKIDQALTIALSGTTRHSFDPSDNSGFLARPTIQKVGGLEDTANSARYRCGVVVQLPASLSGRSGRRDANVSVTTLPTGKRKATFSGVYTALTSNSASAQYAAAAATWCSSELTNLGGNWNFTGSTYDYDEQNKLLRFSRIYEEIIFNEGVGTADVAAIKNQQLAIRKTTPSSNSVPGFQTFNLASLSVEYMCEVDKDVTTDLVTLYGGTIRPHILYEALTVSGGTATVIQSETPIYDLSGNTIRVSLNIQVDGGFEFLSSRLQVVDQANSGAILLPVWNGNPLARHRYDGPITMVRIVSRQLVGRPGIGLNNRGIYTPESYVEISRSLTRSPFEIGTLGSGRIELEGSTLEVVMQRAEEPEGGGGTRVRKKKDAADPSAFPTEVL